MSTKNKDKNSGCRVIEFRLDPEPWQESRLEMIFRMESEFCRYINNSLMNTWKNYMKEFDGISRNVEFIEKCEGEYKKLLYRRKNCKNKANIDKIEKCIEEYNNNTAEKVEFAKKSVYELFYVVLGKCLPMYHKKIDVCIAAKTGLTHEDGVYTEAEISQFSKYDKEISENTKIIEKYEKNEVTEFLFADVKKMFSACRKWYLENVVCINEDVIKIDSRKKRCFFNAYGITSYTSALTNILKINGETLGDIGVVCWNAMNLASGINLAWENKIKSVFSFVKIKVKRDIRFIGIGQNSGSFSNLNVDFEKMCVYLKCVDKHGEIVKSPIKINVDDKDSYEIGAVKLGSNVIRTVRIVRKIIGQKNKYYLQCTYKNSDFNNVIGDVKLSTGRVGIDVGPDNLMIYCESGKTYTVKLPDYNDVYNEIKMLQDKMSRSDALYNKDCLDEKGVYKKGCKLKHSKHWCRYKTKVVDLNRIIVARRKKDFNTIANCILTFGDTFIVERNSYKGWQMGGFGRKISGYAPAEFIEILKNKTETACGKFVKVETCIAATQFDHTDLSFTKHELEERVITSSDGRKHNRDAHAAFNLCFVSDNILTDDCKYVRKSPENYNIEAMKENYEIFCESEKNMLTLA